MSEWISVHDELPGNNRNVDCFVDSGVDGERWPNCYCEDGEWFDSDMHCSIDLVTHWIEIPENPKES